LRAGHKSNGDKWSYFRHLIAWDGKLKGVGRSLMSSSVKQLLLLELLLCSLVIVSSGQSNPPNSSDTVTVRRRIATIIAERLNEGVMVINGVTVLTRTPPSQTAVEEIRRYGDKAVLVLTNHLHAKGVRERRIAVEFLGLLGGRRIVAPLQGVIRHDPTWTIRVLALSWLTQAPPDLAQPIIRRTARTDPDERVRIAAKNILETGTVEGMPKFSVPFKKGIPQRF